MDQTVFVYCPGWSHGWEHSRAVVRMLEDLGFAVVLYLPQWPKRIEDDEPLEIGEEGLVGPDHIGLNLFYEAMRYARPGQTIFVGGHSTGAVMAAAAVYMMQQISFPDPPDVRVVLFSYAPYPEGWIRQAQKTPKSDTLEMTDKFRQQLGGLAIPDLLCPVQVYSGTLEEGFNRRMHKELLRRWPQAISVTPIAKHSISREPAYIEAARANIPRLLPDDASGPDGADARYGNFVILDSGILVSLEAGLGFEVPPSLSPDQVTC